MTVTLESLLKEMTDRDAAARVPEPRYRCGQASSYDRAQTDPNDRATWFANKDYGEFLRVETTARGKEWVIMEDDGPGCISRIWLPILPEDDGRIVRFYLDDDAVPVIEESFNHLISGQSFVTAPFAFVASDEAHVEQMEGLPPGHPPQRGSDFFLPVAYGKRCKITLNEEPFYYGMNYRRYEPGTKVETFSMERFRAAPGILRRVGEVLNASGNVGAGKTLAREAHLDPGQSLRVDLPNGPGAVRAFSLRLPADLAKEDLRSLVVEMTFDGERTVSCPVSEFFGGGCAVRPVRDWNREVTADGRFSCWWVMPFAQSGSVSLRNGGTRVVAAQAELVAGAWDWDARSMHFHSNWRLAAPITGLVPQDWNYVTIRGEGVYAGDTLSVFNPQATWYGEGDERVYIDGESFPSHLGTGTEDYYGFAWGMAHEFSSPFIAMPRRDRRGKQDWSGHTTTSRMRVLDAIPFRTALKFDMEAWHWPDWKPIEYAAATFWYARPGADPSCPLVSVPS